MYCKKCHTLIPDGDVICQECGFDNSLELDVLEETKEMYLNPKFTKAKENKVRIKKIILLIGVILVASLVVFYIINDSKSLEESKPQVTEDSRVSFDTEFTLDSIRMKYPSSTFGASKSTIFYKNNNAYNIEIKTISLSEYNKLINNNEINDSNIGSISTKAYAEDNKYHHIFNASTSYYEITVNFVLAETLESTKIQLELAQILNSMYLSE